ncbi:hypothetical protein F3J34_11425 [Klebsiella sp. Ap-873]|nr:hypothetical protein [Klebsiella sp. Ap-873]
MKIKIIILLLIIMLTACSGNSSFMDRALVGTVDGHTLVIFPAGERNGVKYYRPQFQSECSYNKMYQSDNISTGCRIRDSRITNLHLYREHTEQSTNTKAGATGDNAYAVWPNNEMY